MSGRIAYPPTPETWNWPRPNGFMHAVRIGDELTIGGQQALDPAGAVLGAGDIAAQTRAVFENMKATLERAGFGLDDLVRLNTYYLFEGDDREVTPYWEAMTRVRLEYFADPGPAATAVRIKGLPGERLTIQIEGIAVTGAAKAGRQRIMPADSWDWSIPVPLSQGWRVGRQILVGGQISADRQAKPVAAGDVIRQTEIVWRFIEAVLAEGGGTTADLAHVKICYRHTGDGVSGDDFLPKILRTSALRLPTPGPALTAFGVDLLYPGMLLEIDAVAVVDRDRRAIADGDRHCWAPAQFSDAVIGGGEVYVGAAMALDDGGAIQAPGDLGGQARLVFERLIARLKSAGATPGALKKLNLFLVDAGDGRNLDEAFNLVCQIWAAVAPDAHPAVTATRVYGLPRAGALIAADAIAED